MNAFYWGGENKTTAAEVVLSEPEWKGSVDQVNVSSISIRNLLRITSCLKPSRSWITNALKMAFFQLSEAEFSTHQIFPPLLLWMLHQILYCSSVSRSVKKRNSDNPLSTCLSETFSTTVKLQKKNSDFSLAVLMPMTNISPHVCFLAYFYDRLCKALPPTMVWEQDQLLQRLWSPRWGREGVDDFC